MGKHRRIIVGISGGVDSAVAATRLVDAGHDVIGVFMKNWTESFQGVCPWREDRRAALRVAAHLGIPLLTWNFEKEYAEGVMRYFFDEYAAGRTPNPDIMCNRIVKFDAFVERARSFGADAVATGHYARVVHAKDRSALYIPHDTIKDQTYFLSQVSAAVLPFVEFPLADMTKDEVRIFAKERGLPSADRPDSQGICFVGEVPLKEFLESRLAKKQGVVLSTKGEKLGMHDGAHFYTIGQRAGLGIAHNGVPQYVVKTDVNANTVTVAEGPHAPELFTKEVHAEAMHWIGPVPKDGVALHARLRYRQELVPCTVQHMAAGDVRVQFLHPQRAATPGQFLALYDGTELIGSGIMTIQ
jgi:tRNA-specific 2-thiouridylase